MKHPKVTADQYLAARTDVALRNWIVTQHMGLVGMIARECYRPPLPEMDDLIQVGTFGLIKALQKYRPEVAAFTTYSSWWVRSFIARYVRQNRPAVTGMCRQGSHEIEREMESLTGRKREACRHRLAASKRAVSLDAPIHDWDTTVADLLEASDDVHAEALERETVKRVQRAARGLEDRDRLVLERRMRDHTLQEIGDSLGLSRERVRQLEDRAKDRLRFSLGAEM